MRELTASQITTEALLKLRARGCTVWRQNNITVRRRKNIVKKGQSDIIGYTSQGVFVACEVKTLGDDFSEDQKKFLKDVAEKKGIALIAIQEGYQVSIKNFE